MPTASAYFYLGGNQRLLFYVELASYRRNLWVLPSKRILFRCIGSRGNKLDGFSPPLIKLSACKSSVALYFLLIDRLAFRIFIKLF